jgi:hypothetical protein
MGLPGLQRPCLESGRAWAAALRRIEDRAVVELGRANGRAKVFREILAYMRGTVSIVDKRAVSSIAKRLGLTPRCVRMHLRALERDGRLLRTHQAGLRFPGQRGWATSAYVVPEALPYISEMPFSRQAKARAELRVPAVAAALLAAGHARALRQTAAKTPVLPGGSASSRGAENRKTSTEMGEAHPSVQASASSSVLEIRTVLPLPPRGRAVVENSDHVGGVAERAGATSPSPGSLVHEGHGGPELGCFAPHTPLAARIPMNTGSGIDAKARRRALARLIPSAAAAKLESWGMSWSEAKRRATKYSKIAAWLRIPAKPIGHSGRCRSPVPARRSPGA